MKILSLVITYLFLAFVSNAQRLPLSTSSDSCKYYYYLGWKNVLDDGDYTASEHSYRKMILFDPHFLLGASLLGRISSNSAESDSIEQALQERKSHVKNDERLLLDVFIELLSLTNVRARDPENTNRYREQVFLLAEKNLRKIAHRYPDDLHTKSEYIEVLHYRYGPKVALDSLHQLVSASELENPFLLGYAAGMDAELGLFDKASQKAQRLQDILEGKRVPKPHTVWADLYFKMGKKDEARAAVDKALAIDGGSIDAKRLKVKIEQMK